MGKTFTDATVTQVLTRIKEEIENNSGTGSVKYDDGQTLTDSEKAQARENIGAAGADELSDLDDLVGELNAAMQNMGVLVTNIVKTVDGKSLRVDFSDGTSRTINIEAEFPLREVYYDTETNLLHFLDSEEHDLVEAVYIQGGGGGGGDTVGSIQIGYVTPSAVSCVYGNDLEIEFNLTCKDGDGDIVSGTGSWAVNGITVVRDIPYESRTHTEDEQGNVLTYGNIFNIGTYLQPGENTVRLTISADVGGESRMTRTKSWTFSAVRMYFDWPFDDSQISNGSYTDYWTVYGDISKTTHTLLDGQAQEEMTTDRQSYMYSMKFTNLRHGVHTIERWLTAVINGKEERTDHQYHELICAVAGNDTPVVAISMKQGEMNQYDTLAIPIVVYDPRNMSATVTLSENGTVIDTWEDVDRTLHYWYYTPTQEGAKSLTVTCRGVSRTLIMDVNEVEMGEIAEVEGYDFRFKASDFTSNNAIKSWSSEGVNATFSDNFDWVNGGLQTETDENGTVQQFVRVKAGTTMTINHHLFASDPRRDGMTFKMVFKVTRCRSYDAKFMTCMNENNIGIEMYAHKAYFRSSGQEINVPYNEDDYIELEFEVYPAPRQDGDGRYRYMMAWADGVITSCRLYGASDVFTHVSPADIVIGSDDCDVNVYMVKSYPIKLSLDQHIDNFIMDAPNAAEMVRRYNRNDILTDNKIDYNKLIRQNKDCRVWLYKIDYMPVDKMKKDPVRGCEFHQRWANGDDYYQMDGIGTMAVQGTSSMDYILGAANTDFEFTSLTDGYGHDLLEGGVRDKNAYGNNLFAEDNNNPGHVKVFTVEEAIAAAGARTQGDLGAEWVAVERQEDANHTPTKYIKAMGIKLNDDSCPITYTNTKVNFASCEQVNNMCNAAWYQRFNPYPSLTARDCMEFNMGVQFIQDSGTVLDDKHFVLFGDESYHMYSIANMGNSKKNVHVFHDLSNPQEVCVEVKDNSLNQERMINPDHLSKTEYFEAETWGGDEYYEMRYPDDDPTEEVKSAWYDFVWWMAESDPQQATGEALGHSETYGPYTFRGHDRGDGGVLKGTTVSQYAGTYTHDTFERRMAKMLSECEDHMVMDSFIYHFLYLERHTMQDNVAKNNFWSSTDLQHWDLSKAYDMDTSDGNNNQGQLVFDYGNEFDDWEEGGAKMVFNGAQSTWFVFCGNLYEALQVMFQNREAAGAWSAMAYHKFLTDQQKKVPERCWVQCYWYDYMRPYEQGLHDEGWMTYLDGGQKIHQRAHYEYYEEMYESSKFRGTVSTANNINFRAYTPPYWGGVVTTVGGAQMRRSPSITATVVTTVPTDDIVNITAVTDQSWRAVEWNGYTGYMMIADIDAIEPKGELTITMYNKMYIGIGVGTSRLDLVRAERNTPYTIPFDDKLKGQVGNMVVSVYTAPMVQAISGIEQLYPDTCNFSAGVRLREISVGSSKRGYSNPNLAWLALNNNTLLERLNAQNQPNATSVLDLSNCPSLEYLDTTGSGFTGYNFAKGGMINEATIQAPTTLALVDLKYLTDENFTILDYTKLISLWHENTPGVDSMNLVTRATNLQMARLIDIDWAMTNTTQLERLLTMLGLDENGYIIDEEGAVAVVTGKAYTLVITQRNEDRFNEAWPNLTVTYPEGGKVPQLVVSFVNGDDNHTPILDKNGHVYTQYVDYDSEAYDPIAAGEVDTPTLPATQQYTYTFSGWDNIGGKVTRDKTVTATFTETANTFTVRWYTDRNLSPVKTVHDVAYGSDLVYEDETHELPGVQSQYGTYKIFAGWDKSTGYITGDTDVCARWVSGSKPDVGTKELHEMTVPEIYAITHDNEAELYWEPKDYIDIPVGHDFNFDDGNDPGCVKSRVISQNLYLDGQTSSIVDTGIKLFDADTGDWTLAIEYEFGNTTTGAVLASCFDTNNNIGFKLQYYESGPSILWGNDRYYIGSAPSKGIVVIRHRSGSSTLYIACDNDSGNTYNFAIKASERSAVRYEDFSKSLTLGGTVLDTGGVEDVSSGWIHWCKMWYADLGQTVIHKLANWARETYRWEYDKAGRYLLGDGSSDYCAASFWMGQLAPKGGRLNNTYENAGGWRDCAMRTFANGRFYEALPYEWQAIIKTVRVKSNEGHGSAVVNYSENKIYLPSFTEVYSYSSEPYNTERSPGGLITYTNTTNQTMFYGTYRPDDSLYIVFSGDPTQFSPSSDGHVNGTDGSGYYRDVKNGDMLVISTATNTRYIYVDADTAAKHYYLYTYPKTSCMAAHVGGYWVPAPYYWTRSPYYYGSSTTSSLAIRYWKEITPGSHTYDAASATRGLRFGFSL